MDDITKPTTPTPSGHVSIPVTRRPIDRAPLSGGRSVDGFVSQPSTSSSSMAPPSVNSSPVSLDQLDAPLPSENSVNDTAPEISTSSDMPVADEPSQASFSVETSADEPSSPPEIPAEPSTQITETAQDDSINPPQEPQQITAPTMSGMAPEVSANTEDNLTEDNEPQASESESVAKPEEKPAAEAEKSEGSVVTAPITSAPRHKGHLGAILVAVLISLALIAGAGYAYWQNNKTKADTAKKNTPAVTQKTKNPATADDVQKASDDIDASLKKIDDTKDFQEADLSDTSLGL